MKIPEEIKEHITSLLESGDKLGAVRYIQKSLGLNAEQALAMAELLQSQIPAANTNPQVEGVNAAHVVGTIFTIAGFVLLSVAFVMGFRDYRFTTTAIPVTGRVVRIESRRSDDSVPMYSPVITYVLAGNTREYSSLVSSSSPGYLVGDEVELLINPRDPSEVMINSFLDRWFVVTLLGCMGFVFSLIGFGVRRVLTQR